MAPFAELIHSQTTAFGPEMTDSVVRTESSQSVRHSFERLRLSDAPYPRVFPFAVEMRSLLQPAPLQKRPLVSTRLIGMEAAE